MQTTYEVYMTTCEEVNDTIRQTRFSVFIKCISYAFLPAMNKSLHAMLVKICTSGGELLLSPLLLKCTTQPSVWSYPLFDLHQSSASVDECQNVIFFCVEEFSDTLLLHMHFHVRSHSLRLPLCCHLSYDNKM